MNERTCNIARWCTLLLVALPACNVHKTIEREPSGEYVIAGNEGPVAEVWIGRYDPATKTMRVRKVIRSQ